MPRLYDATAEAIDRRIGWDKLPLPLAMLVLIGLRNVLRRKNLYDTGRGPLDKPDVDDHPRYMTARTLDGTFNNLDDPLMGSLGSRFGRRRLIVFIHNCHPSRTKACDAAAALAA